MTVTTVSLAQSVAGGGASKKYTFDLSNEASEVLGIRSANATGSTRQYIANNTLAISGTTLSINVINTDASSKTITLTMDVAIIAK